MPDDSPLDCPMVTFKFPMCVFDESAHTEEEFNAAQDAIAKVSPFSKHRLSVELMRLGDHGTAIFIWDLECGHRPLASAYQMPACEGALHRRLYQPMTCMCAPLGCAGRKATSRSRPP